MRTSKFGFVAIIFLMVCAVRAEAQDVTSVYTELDEKSCEKLEPDEANGVLYLGRCEGAGGYALHIIEGDLRQQVEVISPDAKSTNCGCGTISRALRLWGRVPNGGSKTECRLH